MILVFLRYNSLLRLHKLKLGVLSEYDSFLSAGIFWPLVFEVIINLIFLPPNVEGVHIIKGSIYVHYNYETLFNFDNIRHKFTRLKNPKNIENMKM